MKICYKCGTEFNQGGNHLQCSSCRQPKHPCKDCGKIIHKRAARCKTCSGRARRGAVNPRWKGGKTYNYRGYVYINCPEHPRAIRSNGYYVFEHILVMERKLGRLLEEGETVHHLNGIKDDNHPDNLELWIKPQPSGIRVSDMIDFAAKMLKRYAPELLAKADK